MFKKLIIIFIIVAGCKQVMAYIDPGTTGMIIGGSIWPIIVGIFAAIGGFILKFFWNPIKNGVRKLWGKGK